MPRKSNFFWTGDFHTHSRYSDGRNTISEMVEAACEKGLKNLAITDHGPSNIGTGVSASETFLAIKEEIKGIQKNHPGIRILTGAEADIVSCQGDIDISKKVIPQLDLLLVGLHPYVMPKSFRDGLRFVLGNQISRVIPSLRPRIQNINTKALVEAMHKFPVTAVTHPGLGMPIDVEEVAQACAATNTAYEINTGHRYQKKDEIKIAGKTGVQFIVNSDAHFTQSVGDLDFGWSLLQQGNISFQQIINLEIKDMI